MRVTVGIIAGLGFAVAGIVTSAVAQPPVPRERAAILKPPQPLSASELPVARGTSADFPAAASLASTPVSRPTAPYRPAAATGPAWLTGVDPNVLPASGTASKTTPVRQLTPSPTAFTKEDATQPKLLGRFNPPPTNEKQPQQPTATTPFRGTSASGAPVYAGPPAYRWYGWGSVTPGANPLAPAGQYPKASANWYSITGATPGAFPVPVSNGVPVVPGTEPPTYGVARTVPAAQPVVPIVAQPEPMVVQPVVTQLPPTPNAPQPEPSKFMPGTSIGGATSAPPVSVPTITAPPVPKLPAASTKPIEEPIAVKPPAAEPKPVPALPPLPAIPAVEAPKVAVPGAAPKPLSVAPNPLPTSVVTEPARDKTRWQTAPESATPAPGTWAPAPGMTPLPTQPVEQPSALQTGSVNGKTVVARGQMSDEQPDPVTTLIKQVCQSRATGVEVRWTGTKKLQVCFEIRGSTEAQKLVADISKRPELTAYQIDFCVLVK